MTYRTCVGCVHGSGSCQERDRVKSQVQGLGVTSLKWKCKFKRLRFRPGDHVIVSTFIEGDYQPEYGDEETLYAWFPAIVIQNKGPKLICFIEPGAKSTCDDYEFSPKKGGTGHVKITMQRIRPAEGVRDNVCYYCRRITRLQGHEEHCPTVRQDWQPFSAVLAPARSAEA